MEIDRKRFITYAAGAVASGALLDFLAACGKTNTPTEQPPTPTLSPELNPDVLRGTVRRITWEQLQSIEGFRQFIDLLFASYHSLTQTPRLKKEELLQHIEVIGDRRQFQERAKQILPQAEVPETLAAATYWRDTTKAMLFNMDFIRTTHSHLPPGQAMYHIGTHEFLHADIQTRSEGALVNRSIQGETTQAYRGGTILSDDTVFYARFDEAWVDSIAGMQSAEALGLNALDRQAIPYAESYFQNGTSLLLPLYRTIGMSRKEVYEKHATSDFDGFVSRIGDPLPIGGSAWEKGVQLATAVDYNDTQQVEATGIRRVVR